MKRRCFPGGRVKVIRIHQLVDKVGISRSSIYEKLNPQSARYDSLFPKPIKLGASAVGWVEAEIDEWIVDKMCH